MSLDRDDASAAPQALAGVRSQVIVEPVMSSPGRQPIAQDDAAAEAALLARRNEFPILETSTYLISNSLGAMPRGVRPALASYVQQWEELGVCAWEESWFMAAERVGNKVAPLIGAPAGSVSTHPNVTTASAVVTSCFDFTGPRNKIVCSELNFPSMLYLYGQQERLGAKLELVPSQDGLTVPLEAMLAAIDEQTQLVPISHVIFRSSYCQDVAAIVERAHSVGAHVLLDTYQSAGIMPIDVTATGVDLAVGGTLKWLCGGPGVAYLYVRPDLAPSLEPSLTGWFANQDPFAFKAASQRYRDDASWRFLNGTTVVPALAAAEPGLEIIGELDLRAVRRKSQRQTQRLVEAALGHGWKVNTPLDPAVRGGAVSLLVPHSEEVAAALLERRVMVDHRPGAGIRLSPHFYSTDDEIDRAIETIAEQVQARG